MAAAQPTTNIWRPQQFYTGVVGSTPASKTAKAAEDATDTQTSVLENIIHVPASDPAPGPEKPEITLSNIAGTDEVKALQCALSINLATTTTVAEVTVSEVSSDTESNLSSRFVSQAPSDTESIPSSPLPTCKTFETEIPAVTSEAREA